MRTAASMEGAVGDPRLSGAAGQADVPLCERTCDPFVTIWHPSPPQAAHWATSAGD